MKSFNLELYIYITLYRDFIKSKRGKKANYICILLLFIDYKYKYTIFFFILSNKEQDL